MDTVDRLKPDREQGKSQQHRCDAAQSAPPTAHVSVVIPAYNAARFIGEAIASAARQVPEPAEIIVIDDGSTDDTAAVVEEGGLARMVRQPNAGVSAARNVGLSIATSSYIVFLDADDRLLPGALAAGIATLDADDLCVMAHGGTKIIDAQGAHVRWLDQPKRVLDTRAIFLGANPVPSQAMLRRKALIDCSGFRTDLAFSEDQELWLRLLAMGGAIKCHGHRVAAYRHHSDQASRDTVSLYRAWLQIFAERRPDPRGATDADLSEARVHIERAIGQYVPFFVLRQIRRRAFRPALRGIKPYLEVLPNALAGTASMVRDRLFGRGAVRMSR